MRSFWTFLGKVNQGFGFDFGALLHSCFNKLCFWALKQLVKTPAAVLCCPFVCFRSCLVVYLPPYVANHLAMMDL